MRFHSVGARYRVPAGGSTIDCGGGRGRGGQNAFSTRVPQLARGRSAKPLEPALVPCPTPSGVEIHSFIRWRQRRRQQQQRPKVAINQQRDSPLIIGPYRTPAVGTKLYQFNYPYYYYHYYYYDCYPRYLAPPLRSPCLPSYAAGTRGSGCVAAACLLPIFPLPILHPPR